MAGRASGEASPSTSERNFHHASDDEGVSKIDCERVVLLLMDSDERPSARVNAWMRPTQEKLAVSLRDINQSIASMQRRLSKQFRPSVQSRFPH